MLKSLLAHPLTRGADLDDPKTTALRRRIVREKKFLRRIYEEWYSIIARSLPAGGAPVLELGSGAGFMDEFVPGLITSEIFHCPGVRIVLDGQRLPFADASLRAIVMTDVMHHLPNVRAFFTEATRCIRVGGAISMIEPWVSGWSKLIYRKLHHEPFLPAAQQWEFPATGPLSGANGALPWIVFVRDRQIFQREFPHWRIESIRPMMPLRYLVSGGVSMRSLMPSFTFPIWRAVDSALTPIAPMFAHIVLRRI